MKTGREFKPSCYSIHLLLTLPPPPDPKGSSYILNFPGSARTCLFINDAFIVIGHAGSPGLGKMSALESTKNYAQTEKWTPCSKLG